MSWGNEEEPGRRKYRNRYGADEDAFGEADAEDHSDDGSAEDLSFEAHAAGLDRDLGYERKYEERQNYNPTPPDRWTSGYPGQSGPPPQSTPGELPTRAQQFQNRVQRHSRRIESHKSARQQGGGIDGLFDTGLNLGKFIPCSNPILFMLFLMIGGLGCTAMAILAFSSLTRHLGF
jgi:hypothetical protein